MKRIIPLICGILIGSTLFGGSIAYAAGILAERSTHRVFVDGTEVELEAYTINGHNYVKLRDIGRLVNFNVYWDNSVQIESHAPYTGVAPTALAAAPVTTEQTVPAASDRDWSTEANAAVFDGVYSRDAYNMFRQTIIGKDTAVSDSRYVYRTAKLDTDSSATMRDVAAALSSWPAYSVRILGDGNMQVTAKYVSSYQAAADFCAPLISGFSGLDDAAKVERLAFYLCDHMTYRSDAVTSPSTVLTGDSVTSGNCMSYARCFMFLCNLADIPCVYVHSSSHQWNQVYVGGSWWNVDVSALDAGDNPSIRDYQTVLCTDEEMQNSIYRQTQPALTAFAKELLIPGSTK